MQPPNGFDPTASHATIRVIASEYIEIVLLADLLRRASQAAPYMSFEVGNDFSAEATRTALGNAQPDFFIGSTRHLLKGRPKAPLFRDVAVCMGCRSNPGLGETVTPDQFLMMSHIYVEQPSGVRTTPRDQGVILQYQDLNPQIRISSFQSLPLHIVGSDKVCLLPRLMAQHFAEHWPVKIARFLCEEQPFEFWLQWNADIENDPAKLWFRDYIVRAATPIRHHFDRMDGFRT